MGANFITNQFELQKAFDQVSNSSTGNEWAIFEYDGNSSIVKVGDFGEGGLSQLVSSFDPSKVQYGFSTVLCPGIKQRKVVLIHWQGASVPVTRLANTASNISAVKEFVKKVNLTVYARTEEDIDIDSIQSEINKLATTNNNQSSGNTMFEIPAPVGSSWTPVKPNADIDLLEREKFWKQQQEEEQQRRREEVQKNEEKSKLYQIERKRLENQIHETALHKMTPKSVPPIFSSTTQTKKGALVTGRTHMFEQKVQELVETKPSTKPKNFKYEVAITKPLGKSVNRENESNHSNGINSTENFPKASELAKQFNGGPVISPTVHKMVTPMVMCPPPGIIKNSVGQTSPPIVPSTISKSPLPISGSGLGLKCVALWDYQANENNEISFNPDDVITEVRKLHDGWWQGKAPNGQVGLFPSNFVKEI